MPGERQPMSQPKAQSELDIAVPASSNALERAGPSGPEMIEQEQRRIAQPGRQSAAFPFLPERGSQWLTSTLSPPPF
jgi:hypothetical protein